MIGSYNLIKSTTCQNKTNVYQHKQYFKTYKLAYCYHLTVGTPNQKE